VPLLWANRRVPFHFSEERMERNREEWWKERLNNRLHIGARLYLKTQDLLYGPAYVFVKSL
jgi:hypothetical protein